MTHLIHNNQYNARGYFNNVVLKGNAGGGIMSDVSKNITLIADTRLGYDFTPVGQKSTISKTEREFTFNRIHLFHFTLISIGIAYRF
jgi:hypothetical protein